MLPHTQANLKKVRTFTTKRRHLIEQVRHERQTLNRLDYELRQLHLKAESEASDISRLEKDIRRTETRIAYLDRDIEICEREQEAYLHELFGNYRTVPRNNHSTDIYFGGFHHAASTHDRGDGVGHGHALLYNDGQIRIFREPMDSDYEIDSSLSIYRYTIHQNYKNRSKNKKHRPAP